MGEVNQFVFSVRAFGSSACGMVGLCLAIERIYATIRYRTYETAKTPIFNGIWMFIMVCMIITIIKN